MKLEFVRTESETPSHTHGGYACRITWELKLNGVVIGTEGDRYPWEKRKESSLEPHWSLQKLHDSVIKGLEQDEAKPVDVAAVREKNTTFHLTWTAGARPPAHQEPMTGSLTFDSFDKAVAFMKRQASDSKLVSLTERTSSYTDKDRSQEAAATIRSLSAEPAQSVISGFVSRQDKEVILNRGKWCILVHARQSKIYSEPVTVTVTAPTTEAGR